MPVTGDRAISSNASTLIWSMTTGPDPGGWTEAWPSPDFLVLSHSPFTPSTTYVFELTYIEGEDGVPLCGLPVTIVFTTTSWSRSPNSVILSTAR